MATPLPAEVIRLLQEFSDRGSLELRERDEEVEDVAEKSDGLRSAPPDFVERLQETALRRRADGRRDNRRKPPASAER
jgi:hypothetical protein